ncbi:unannotated protein [freshwater metagenome]|uniref:Unannotated protein n=1 Tax=freshwater metagenome TaxID=449393 RepID=A0A6J7CW49_9ZZZZ|nr:glycosyltransferase [Actinomycetota bacterium]
MARTSFRGTAVSARKSVSRLNMRGRRSVAKQIVARARRRAVDVPERQGVTVVTVTWNSMPFLKAFLQGVRTFGGDDVEILVVDNNSDDGTAEFLAAQPDVTTVTLPFNFGHGLGLDTAFINARTTHVIALDVDAFPISKGWLSTVIEPLAQGAVVAGAYVQRAFIHPSYLAMRRKDFLDMKLSFVPIGVRTQSGEAPQGLFLDVGEALCQTVAVARGSVTLHRVPITSTRGDGMVGSVYGDVVYHNFYSTQGNPNLVEQARLVWASAVTEYLPA